MNEMQTRLKPDDTLPYLPVDESYDFRLRAEGWQLVVRKLGVTWKQAMDQARMKGIKLDTQGYLLK